MPHCEQEMKLLCRRDITLPTLKIDMLIVVTVLTILRLESE